MLAKPKLVSPRLTRWPRFALDDEGVLTSDSCVAIATPTTSEALGTGWINSLPIWRLYSGASSSTEIYSSTHSHS